MKLKVKFLKWDAGLPTAMLNRKTAKKIGVHHRDRISISTSSKQLSTSIDLIETIVKKDEIAVSSEIRKSLNLRKGQVVDVNFAPTSKSLSLIKKKLHKQTLSGREIKKIIQDVTNNSLSESEIALFISAMYKNKMTIHEKVSLIDAILETGHKLRLKNKFIVDKHCIGGVAGNRTTPLVVSICAAGGLIIPKTSSRAITSAAGTADVIETIAEVDFPVRKLEKMIKKTNGFMVWGGSLGLVPADGKIIQIERALRIDPESQLVASIMSKKLALGSNYILIDIPYGKSAKVGKQRALSLAKEFEKLGRHYKKKIKCVLTKGDQPIGNGIGPVLELIDIIKILERKKGPQDLEEKALFLAGELFEMTKKAKKGKGKELAREILDSGKAFEKFKQIIKIQNGKLRKLKPGKFKKDILAKRDLKIIEINNKKINSLAKIAGCPMDKSSGLHIFCHVGEKIDKKEKILTIYAESKSRLKKAISFYKKEKPIRFK